MSQKFNVISIVLIVILVVILGIVIFNYFGNNDNSFSANSNPPFGMENTENNYSEEKLITITNSGRRPDNDSKETVTSVSSGEQVMTTSSETIGEVSGEYVNSNIDTNDTLKNDENQIQTPSASRTDHQVIITSTGDISNSEKKEVLDELDQTLMELFEVVDMVETVDETRLPTGESGGNQ